MGTLYSIATQLSRTYFIFFAGGGGGIEGSHGEATRRSAGPSPFGVPRVPAEKVAREKREKARSLPCLSAFRAVATHVEVRRPEHGDYVPIAFRRSGRSRLRRRLGPRPGSPESPLPFGVPRVPDDEKEAYGNLNMGASPLPFGVHRVPAWRTARSWGPTRNVSIAFRRSPRSGRTDESCDSGPGSESPLPFGVHRVPASIATVEWTRYPKSSPLPFGVHRVPAPTSRPNE